MRVSVCMATYNGAAYLQEQLDSILPQLGPDDELVVSDDCSQDATLAILSTYCDSRLRIIQNPAGRGHVQNFANAMENAAGEFIALSDQDDIWLEKRLDKMLDVLLDSPQSSLVVGDFLELDETGVHKSRYTLGQTPSIRTHQLLLLALGRAKYFGCTFLFRRWLLRYILPIPKRIEAHDIWISLNACLHGGVRHLEEPTLVRRIHGTNLTPPQRRALPAVLHSRLNYAVSILQNVFVAPN